MARSKDVVSAVDGRHVVIGIGGLYVALGTARVLTQLPLDRSIASVAIVFAFIAGSGAVLVVGGYRLPNDEIHPQFYSTIAWWCLGGIGAILGMLALYHVQPDTGLTEPERSIPILTAFASAAGFGVGTYDARARTATHTLQQQNRTLERVQTQLEESNERLEQFAYVASHDLKEPLRMVSSYLQLVDSRYADELDEEGEEFLEYAVDGAERMREMIDDLLEYSRIETRGEPFEPVDLGGVMDDVRKNLELRLEETDADLEVEDLPRVEGDASQLQQLFQNLLSNAVAYSGEEPPRVTVTAERDGDEWIVSVSDEGIGIDSADQKRIFRIFQRLHSHEEYEGTGIGLALCQRIVERHGGDIWVDSEPDEGATFSVALPAAGEHRREATDMHPST
ncbi:sensor histidine kinase [Natronorubrum texcoconense]|uniref:histidine kinase n=1 Tax=Natronorubrum texcoconense TaxID=1095776 RepID=A0A1G8XEF7_9EURY|nr:ATP-binding protein [Natronorubrum texcoconense]SDJ88841.1 His Kinase A (phospho-acceptor) domain-containing protein [Natronorubrum texcoconense]